MQFTHGKLNQKKSYKQNNFRRAKLSCKYTVILSVSYKLKIIFVLEIK